VIILYAMRKIRLILEYDGTAYHGWQIQPESDTVQGILEDSVEKICGERTKVMGAGRTDAGVHALGQVAAFRTGSLLPPGTMQKALNAVLPPDIRVLNAAEVDDAFQPRNHALRKSYFYLIAHRSNPSAFLRRYVWTVAHPLDLSPMNAAARRLIGLHDFSSFMGSGSGVRNMVREVFSLHITPFAGIDFMTARLAGNFIRIRIEANGFLRHMVRNIVGTLVEIGRGRVRADSVAEILAARDRRLAGPTAPPNGLFLEGVSY
jgi:tRNA pseudouridine38-40 synthase